MINNGISNIPPEKRFRYKSTIGIRQVINNIKIPMVTFILTKLNASRITPRPTVNPLNIAKYPCTRGYLFVEYKLAIHKNIPPATNKGSTKLFV
ncbi:MAG: hypothetical protein NTZ80_04475 [Patescibacteria group bacterium]|nr:hypothetical protein [Patescibacteria group bacterium]